MNILLTQSQNKIDSLQKADQQQYTLSPLKEKILKESILSICKYQKTFIRRSLEKLYENSPNNTEIICKYIIAEQNEINIKESTKEGKIKVLVDLVKFVSVKDFANITKEDIFAYLKIRKYLSNTSPSSFKSNVVELSSITLII